MRGASAGPRRLRVVTWNVRAGIGPGEPFPPAWWRHVRHDRLERIAEFVRDLSPDVVTLQEVAVLTVDGELLDEAAALAAWTGLQARYAAVQAYPLVEPDGERTVGATLWGNAVLTREPLAESFAMGLPRADDDDLVEPAEADHRLAGVRYADTDPGHREHRVVMGGVVAGAGVEGAGVFIATTHLTYIGREQRGRQAGAAREIAESAAGDRPLIFTGDLNAPLDALELAGAVTGLQDALGEVGLRPGDDRRRSCGRLAIDHVLVRGLAVAACRVATEAGDLSDHWPVVADLVVG